MSTPKKYGAFAGVFTPSLLTILGVIMYLRMGKVVGNSGLWGTFIIVLLAHLISFATGLSVSSISTDKKVKAGGIYYILSRSLGLPIGGAIGVTLYIGTALSIALYIIGFGESFNDYFQIGLSTNDLRITGAIALILITVVAFISTSFAIKTQFFILAAIVLSLLSIFFGHLDLEAYKATNEIVDTSESLLKFDIMFALFFPAVTGFTAGVAMSGDLKDPKKDIPKGTIWAIITGFIVYTGLGIFLYYVIGGGDMNSDGMNILRSDNNILKKIAISSDLVVLGIWGATLSSALGGILGAPRILQAMSLDKISPRIFGRGVGKDNEPRNALILTFIIALGGILIGKLDIIAPIVATFYLAAYGFINLAQFLESWASSDFLPSLKLPRWIPLIGFLATFGIMFKLDFVSMFISLLVISGIFLYLTRKQIAIGTGDVWQSVWSSVVKTGLKRMDRQSMHKRNWEPNILLFSGGTNSRPHLIDFSRALAGRLGMISNFDLIENPTAKVLFPKSQQSIKVKEFEESGIFFRRQEVKDLYQGIETISSTYGFSGVEPNTVLMGWARNTKNPHNFAQLTKSLTEHDFNVLYLDYDKQKGFGKFKQIDIWWRRQSKNNELSLSLIKFLLTSNDWRSANVRILYLNNKNEAKENIEKKIESILEEFRVKANIKVVNNAIDQKPFYEVIKVVSYDADLIIAGIPELNDSNEKQFVTSTNELVDGIGTTLLIKASSDFEATEISSIQSKETEIELKVEESKTYSNGNVIPLIFPSDETLNSSITDLDNKFSTVVSEYDENFRKFYFQQFKSLINASKNIFLKETENVTFYDDKYAHLFQSEIIHKHTNLFKTFESSNFAQIEERLGSSIEDLYKSIEKFTLTLPKKVTRTWTQEQLQIESNDKANLRRKKRWLRFLSRFKDGKIKTTIHYKKLAENKVQLSFLKNFHSVLREFGLAGYQLNDEIRKTVVSIINNPKLLSKEDSLIESIEKKYDSLNELMEMIESSINYQIFNTSKRFCNDISHDIDKVNVNFENEEHFVKNKASKKINLEIREYPKFWKRNQKLFTNQTITDLNLSLVGIGIAQLHNWVESKLKEELYDAVSNDLLHLDGQLEELTSSASIDDLRKKSANLYLPENYTLPSSNEAFDIATDSLNEYLELLPDRIKVIDEDSLNNFHNQQGTGVNSFNISLFKLTDYITETTLLSPLQEELDLLPNQLNEVIGHLQQNTRLIRYTLSARSEDNAQDEGEISEVLNNTRNEVEEVRKELKLLFDKVSHSLDYQLKTTLSELTTKNFIQKADQLEQYIKKDYKRKGIKKISYFTKKKGKDFSKSISKSIHKKRNEVFISDYIFQNRELENIHDKIRTFIENHSISRTVIDSLPFYYKQLFLGKHFASHEILENRKIEIEAAQNAVNHLELGATGGILVIGEPLSGKSYLCEYIGTYLCDAPEIYRINPPVQGSSSLKDFEKSLQNATNKFFKIDKIFDSLPEGGAVILNHIELWWERNLEGNEVIKKIGQLIEQYSDKITFIVNVNVYTFKHLDKTLDFGHHFVSSIQTTPFLSDEIKDIVLERHRSGGFNFILNGHPESNLSTSKIEKLFRKHHSVSKGILGIALQNWLGYIESVEGKSIYITEPVVDDFPALEDPEWLIMLTQFVLHRNMTLEKIYRIYLQENKVEINRIFTGLLRSGLIEEFSKENFRINLFALPYVIEILKKAKLI